MSAPSLSLDTPDLASLYERASAERQFKSGQALIQKLAVRPGERVLDVGCGTGLLAEYAAGLVGPSGAVVGVDPLAFRVAIAQKKVRPNLSFRVDDANDLHAFADASFDVVVLNAVIHWISDKRAPIRTFFRILRSGGRLGISTGSRTHPNRLHVIRNQVLAREPYRSHPGIDSGLPHRIDADEARALVVEAGFRVQSLDVVPHVQHHPTAEAAIEFSQASSFGNFLGRVPESLRTSARAEIVRELEQLRTPEGIRQEGARIVLVAVKDAS